MVVINNKITNLRFIEKKNNWYKNVVFVNVVLYLILQNECIATITENDFWKIVFWSNLYSCEVSNLY